jgi:hypothetical protein
MDEFHPYFSFIHILEDHPKPRISSKFRICMDRNLFLPLNWEDLRWWLNTTKRLVNDISGGRPCGAHSVVAKVEEHFKDKLS